MLGESVGGHAALIEGAEGLGVDLVGGEGFEVREVCASESGLHGWDFWGRGRGAERNFCRINRILKRFTGWNRGRDFLMVKWLP